MTNFLKKYKRFELSFQEIKASLGDYLYNVPQITPEKINADDVIYAIRQFLLKNITPEELVNWVNVVWFTDLYVYASKEENAIASVMTLLETLDEGVDFSEETYLKMIECLEKNIECEL